MPKILRDQFTYAALERTTVDVVTAQLTDSHASVLMGVHLDKGKSTISLETSLNHVTKVLEEWNEVVLSGVWSKIADVDSGLPCWSLRCDHIVACDTVSWEVVMAEGSGWSHAHRRHGLLLSDRGLSLLVGPVASNRTRSKPLAVHGAQSLLSILTLSERNETVTSGSASLHIPHDTSLGD